MTYTVKVTEADLRVIAAALQELPYKLSAPLLAALQAQVNEQDKPAPAGRDPEPEDNPPEVDAQKNTLTPLG